MQQSLLILHLVALMCEKLGPSMLQNTPQTLAFIESTLKRACTILHADQEGLGTVFITETLTMSLGMLSAVLGGAVEVMNFDTIHLKFTIKLKAFIQNYYKLDYF